MSNLVNFNEGYGKFENLHFDVLYLSIAYKVSAQKELSLRTAKNIQTLKKTDFLFEN